jgi:nucleoside-diphosphate-sugar epimerase
MGQNNNEKNGRSKLAAERGLADVDIDGVALRATLVYGHGIKGNMAQLMRRARSPLSGAVRGPESAPLGGRA